MARYSNFSEAERAYYNDIKGAARLSAEEEKALFRAAHAGNERAKEKIAASYELLVKSLAAKFCWGELEFLDCAQEGRIGLLTAIDKFDSRRGLHFSTYAYYWIKQAIFRAQNEQGRAIRLPEHRAEEVSQLERAEYELRKPGGRTPSAAELVIYLNWNAEKLAAVRKDLNLCRMASLEAPAGEGAALGDFLPDERTLDPAAETEKNMAIDAVDAALDAELSARDREIVKARYGFLDGTEYTLQELGQMHGISHESARQIIKAAKKSLEQGSLEGWAA
jgi:RNA polymerase primary sigma factor